MSDSTKAELEDIRHEYRHLVKGSFLPGLVTGFLLVVGSKVLINNEFFYASKSFYSGPLHTIKFSVLFACAYSYWNWRKRVILEELAYREELDEDASFELYCQYLKAGRDFEQLKVKNYYASSHLV